MKLYVDDIRTPKDDSWLVARTVEQAQRFITMAVNNEHELEWISLDHDLGGDSTTRELMTWLSRSGIRFDKGSVHSSNPVGVNWLKESLRKDFGEPIPIVEPPEFF